MTSQILTRPEFDKQTRARTRAVTRDAIGLTISVPLCISFPYMIPSTIWNSVKLGRSIRKIRELRLQGFRIKKRMIFAGVAVGAASKLAVAAVTLGHDDLLVALDDLLVALNDLSNISAKSREVSKSVLGAHKKWAAHPIIDASTGIVSAPTTAAEELIGAPTAEARAKAIEVRPDVEESSGWHASAAVVAEDIIVAGTVQLSAEVVADKAINGGTEGDPNGDRRKTWGSFLRSEAAGTEGLQAELFRIKLS